MALAALVSVVAAAAPFVPSLPPRPAVVWAVGDGADGGRAATALARRIAASRPARLLYLGDVYPLGGPVQFRTAYAPVYGRLARITAPTPGNHDWPLHAIGYDPYWARVRGARTPRFYAFRAGGWQVLSLNSETSREPGGDQARWLSRQLRAGGTCRLAFWHRPFESAGRHGDDPGLAPLWQLLRGRARIVVAGHDHDMQRLRPRDGIVQFVSGAGGHSRYPVDRSDPRIRFANDTDWGALRVELRPGQARYAFVTTTGRTLDAGTLRCRPAGAGRRG